MTQAEFASWIEFHRRWPFDDRHRFHMPAALIASQLGGDTRRHLDWLQPQEESVDALSAAFGVPVR